MIAVVILLAFVATGVLMTVAAGNPVPIVVMTFVGVVLTLIPSNAVESMGMGGFLGAAALQQQRLTGGGGQAE